MASSGLVSDKARPPRPREVVPRKGLLRRWGQTLLGAVGRFGLGQRGMLILGGPVFFQTLRTACDLDLFGLLKRKPGLTLGEIASQLHLEEYPTRVLLLSCVALGLARKRGARYRTAPFYGRVLDRSDPRSMFPILEWMHHIVYPSMFHYAEAIRESRAAGLQVFPGEGESLYERLSHDERLRTIFHEAMQMWTGRTIRRLLERIDFSGFKRIVDIGGGNGETLLAVTQGHASLQGTLFDLPPVAEMATERFKELKRDDRLKAVGGNILEDDFPRGHDCLLFSRFLPIFSEETNRILMKRAREALEPGGMVCIAGSFVKEDETGPLLAAMLSPYFLCTVNGVGRHYSWLETSTWLEEAGFVDITRVKLDVANGALLGWTPW